MQILPPTMMTGENAQAGNGKGGLTRDVSGEIDGFIGLLATTAASEGMTDVGALRWLAADTGPDVVATGVPVEFEVALANDIPVDMAGKDTPQKAVVAWAATKIGMPTGATGPGVPTDPAMEPPLVFAGAALVLPSERAGSREGSEGIAPENDADAEFVLASMPDLSANQPTDTEINPASESIRPETQQFAPAVSEDPLEAVAEVIRVHSVPAASEGQSRSDSAQGIEVAASVQSDKGRGSAATPIVREPIAPNSATTTAYGPAVGKFPQTKEHKPVEIARREVLAPVAPPVSHIVVRQALAEVPKNASPGVRVTDPGRQLVSLRAHEPLSSGIDDGHGQDARGPASAWPSATGQPPGLKVNLPGMQIAVAAHSSPPEYRILLQDTGDRGDLLSTGALASLEDSPKATAVERSRAELPVVRSVIHQITQSVSRPQGEGVIEVRLQPEELGRVRLTMVAAEAGMSIQVTAERPETLELIRRHIDLFESDLRKQGFAGMSFSFGSEHAESSDRHARGDAPDDAAVAPPGSDARIVAVIGPSAIHENGKLDMRI